MNVNGKLMDSGKITISDNVFYRAGYVHCNGRARNGCRAAGGRAGIHIRLR